MTGSPYMPQCADCHCRDAAPGESYCPDCRMYRKRFEAQSRAMEQAGEFSLPRRSKPQAMTADPSVDQDKELKQDLDELAEGLDEARKAEKERQ